MTADIQLSISTPMISRILDSLIEGKNYSEYSDRVDQVLREFGLGGSSIESGRHGDNEPFKTNNGFKLNFSTGSSPSNEL
jgi:hypothetical protein